MVLEKQFINTERFLDIVERPEYEDRIVELVEGDIVEMPFPSPIHAAILVTLSTSLGSFVTENGLGRVLGGNAPFVLERHPDGKDTVRGLDIAFISSARWPEALPRKPFLVGPDLAVEIISPSNRADDIEKKVQQLLQAGTTLIWIVYPDLRTVTIHTVDGATTLTENDDLTGGDILPGFEVRVSDIFPS